MGWEEILHSCSPCVHSWFFWKCSWGEAVAGMELSASLAALLLGDCGSSSADNTLITR